MSHKPGMNPKAILNGLLFGALLYLAMAAVAAAGYLLVHEFTTGSWR